MSPTPLPWLPAWIEAHGRFASVAQPWIRLGVNCLPILPGGKSPAVAGWGVPGEGPALHSEGSPKIESGIYAAWQRDFRNHNVALLPATIGAMVVDVDAPERLETVLEVCGPTDYRTYSGRVGGGIHLWYHGTTRSKNKITTGVDLKSTGGYVIAPGSLHDKTGNEYTASPELVAALAAGVLVLPRARDGWRMALERLGTGITNPTRFDLNALSDKLQGRHGMRTFAKAIRLIADGEPFAEPGEREGVIYRVIRLLADEWPAADVDAIVGLFATSAARMEAAHAVGIPIADQIRQKWARFVADRESISETDRDRDREHRRVAWTLVGVDSDQTADLDAGPLVVHHGRAYYLRIGDRWSGPRVRETITPDLLAALGALYETSFEDTSGVLAAHGRPLADLRNSLSARRTTYDVARNVLTVACAPVRADLEPEYSETVERLMMALAGPHYARLRQWAAGVLRTDVPCRALVLSGPRHTGKSLFLAGVGRLWRDGAAVMGDVLGKRFNSSIARAGLAVADDDAEGRSADTGEALAGYLRRAVSDRTQRLERKGFDVETIDGCARYAVATNDADALVQGAVSHKLNDESLAAFGDRLLHVPVPHAARAFVATLDTDRLVQGDEIARHVLWLADQRVAAEDRFWVGPGDETLARLASVSCGARREILGKIAAELTSGHVNTDVSKVGRDQWLALDGDRVVVSAPAMLAVWYDKPHGLTVTSLGSAVRSLGLASGCEQPTRSATGPRVAAIATGLVLWAADRFGI